MGGSLPFPGSEAGLGGRGRAGAQRDHCPNAPLDASSLGPSAPVTGKNISDLTDLTLRTERCVWTQLWGALGLHVDCE